MEEEEKEGDVCVIIFTKAVRLHHDQQYVQEKSWPFHILCIALFAVYQAPSATNVLTPNTKDCVQVIASTTLMP